RVWLEPALVGRRSVDARQFASREPQVHGELSAVMDGVVEEEPERVADPHVTHLPRAHRHLERLLELSVVQILELRHRRLMLALEGRDHVLPFLASPRLSYR